MKPRDFIDLSRNMLVSEGGKPSQVVLRRSVSTAYYAMFHALAANGANLLVGGIGASRNDEAWRQVYRALEHGAAKNACNDKTRLASFPQGIQDFGNMFVAMQEKRHKADYDPMARFSKSTVQQDINAVDQAVGDLNSESKRDRRAFAAYVLFKFRK